MLLLDELEDRLEFEDDWLNDELDEAIDDLLFFEEEREDELEFENDWLNFGGPSILPGCNTALVKDGFIAARKSVKSAINLLNRISSSNKTTEKNKWNNDRRFVRWFGTYHKKGVKRLLRRYERIRSIMYSPRLKIKCGKLKTNRANPITKTAVLGRNYKSYPYSELVVTIIHEIGHIVLGGVDFREHTEKALCLAKKRPSLARVNLDNLSYFAVEVGGINGV